ncbi:hypothetical protein [Nocardia blacklockiae]|uniref:hypothetical protein n=1 Tax=Nocardia blacklockiae TaxID=480036 RepID=UPI001892F9D0|nr:hypothetical protein [Nocardia blacklockiae]MBF6172902.1 hypothetical protein [Nocardia blacklockiae]
MSDELADGIRARFDDREKTELDSCRHQVNEWRSFGVLDLLVSWALHVEKIDSDRFRVAHERGVWGAYDLVAAFSIRDFLAECIERLDGPLKGKVADVAEEHDARLRAITVEDGEKLLLPYVDFELTTAPWWWHRIPDSGPLLDELLASAAH